MYRFAKNPISVGCKMYPPAGLGMEFLCIVSKFVFAVVLDCRARRLV